MATRRSYDDGCAGAHALDLVGERWALLVVRELLLGPKRFTDLRAGLHGISANVLTQRLQELERSAILWRRRLPPPASAWVYELTPWGRELEVVITELGRWGARSPFMDREAPLSVDSMVLSLRTMFRPEAAAGVTATYELRFADEQFAVEVDDGRLTITRGPANRPVAVVDTDPATLAGIVYDSHRIADAIGTGRLSLVGDAADVERFSALFSLPEQAPKTCLPPRFEQVSTALDSLDRHLS